MWPDEDTNLWLTFRFVDLLPALIFDDLIQFGAQRSPLGDVALQWCTMGDIRCYSGAPWVMWRCSGAPWGIFGAGMWRMSILRIRPVVLARCWNVHSTRRVEKLNFKCLSLWRSKFRLDKQLLSCFSAEFKEDGYLHLQEVMHSVISLIIDPKTIKIHLFLHSITIHSFMLNQFTFVKHNIKFLTRNRRRSSSVYVSWENFIIFLDKIIYIYIVIL